MCSVDCGELRLVGVLGGVGDREASMKATSSTSLCSSSVITLLYRAFTVR